MSKRLFVAIDLPDSTRQLLAAIDPHVRGVRWTDLAQMHLTLGFFGDVSDETNPALRERFWLRVAAASHRSRSRSQRAGPFLETRFFRI